VTTGNSPLRDFVAISLDALVERAALLRRVDNKYTVSERDFAELARRLRRDHQVLEIEGRRLFEYSTTYFETPDLRCLSDHIEDRLPRFKVRTRLYEDSGECVFEVKLKRSEDETDKRQIGYAREARRRVTEEAGRCLREALAKARLEAPEKLRPALTTSFRRATLVARDGSERLTSDFGVRLIGLDGETRQMRPGLLLLET
jgi:VTC domain